MLDDVHAGVQDLRLLASGTAAAEEGGGRVLGHLAQLPILRSLQIRCRLVCAATELGVACNWTCDYSVALISFRLHALSGPLHVCRPGSGGGHTHESPFCSGPAASDWEELPHLGSLTGLTVLEMGALDHILGGLTACTGLLSLRVGTGERYPGIGDQQRERFLGCTRIVHGESSAPLADKEDMMGLKSASTTVARSTGQNARSVCAPVPNLKDVRHRPRQRIGPGRAPLLGAKPAVW